MVIYGHIISIHLPLLLVSVKIDLEKQTITAICAELAQIRKDQEISQQRLSEIADISRSGLRHVESLKYHPTLYTLLKIARALNIDLSILIAKHTQK